MDVALPIDLRRAEHYGSSVMSEADSVSFAAATPRPASKASPQVDGSPSPVGAAPAPHPMATASVTVRMEPSSSQPSRPLKFSVENILDPNKFTGHTVHQTAPRLNGNLFHPYPAQFFHPHHPWLLQMNPLLPPQHPHHQLDVHGASVESEDSIYDRSDLDSGT